MRAFSATPGSPTVFWVSPPGNSQKAPKQVIQASKSPLVTGVPLRVKLQVPVTSIVEAAPGLGIIKKKTSMSPLAWGSEWSILKHVLTGAGLHASSVGSRLGNDSPGPTLAGIPKPSASVKPKSKLSRPSYQRSIRTASTPGGRKLPTWVP